jgi:hypothetical protein
MKNFFLMLSLLSMCSLSCLAQEPYKLGVQENVQGSSGTSSYPAPQMMSMPATPAPKKKKKPISGQASQNNIQSNIQTNQNTSPMNGNVAQETFNAGVTAVALPPAFLGIWQVHGQRTGVEALPEFQAAAQQAFTMSNDQLWNISGSQGNYTLGSNTGISTSLFVDKVQGNTAFVRYQHPVGNTMAQEAIVMSLRPGGAQFDGLERISIVKQGLPQPRAKVTYQLTGNRQ